MINNVIWNSWLQVLHNCLKQRATFYKICSHDIHPVWRTILTPWIMFSVFVFVYMYWYTSPVLVAVFIPHNSACPATFIWLPHVLCSLGCGLFYFVIVDDQTHVKYVAASPAHMSATTGYCFTRCSSIAVYMVIWQHESIVHTYSSRVWMRVCI
jgi:hypothetical protein